MKGLMKKFGVRKIAGNLGKKCKVCGLRLGNHYGSKCPTKSEVLYKGKDYDSSVKDANEEEPDHDLEYHDKKCEGR